MSDTEESISELREKIQKLEEHCRFSSQIIHNMTVANQSAWIEWRNGGGAESAMVWIHNGLCGPGLIPNEDEPHFNNAQEWYNANQTDRLSETH